LCVSPAGCKRAKPETNAVVRSNPTYFNNACSADALGTLAVITTHPIQYQVPIWQALAASGRLPFEVWYLTDFGTRPDLDKTFQWDIPTLSGYPYRILNDAEGVNPTNFWSCRLREPLRRRLSSMQANAVWIQGWQVAGYWQVVQEARAAGVSVWLRAESNDLRPVPHWKRPIKHAALMYLFSQVDRFLYIGAANRRLYESFGVPQSKLVPALYAVDNARFASQAAAIRGHRDALRRQWGIDHDAFCVLFCGKFIPKKRPFDLIRAAMELRTNGRMPNIHLLFAGTGELGEKLRGATDVVFDAESRRVNFESGIARPPASFAGFLNQIEISRAYVAADCLVLPSDHGETWGLVVNEALASGLPCIVSDACGCAEDMIAREWVFRMGDIMSLADRLMTLCQMKNKFSAGVLPEFEDTVGAVDEAYTALARSH
jgi:glycosyltransferase involved in cell wall biosynthesis